MDKALGFDRATFNQGKNAKFNFTILDNEQPTLTAKGPGGGQCSPNNGEKRKELEMSKYINADELKQKIPEVSASVFGCSNCSLLSKWEIEEIIDEMPSADVRENIHGEWIRQEYYCVCSNCHKYYISIGDKYDFNFCPRCGADMRGEQND